MTENKEKWIEMTDNYGHSSYFCSRCGTQEGKPYDVCPNCKANMRGNTKRKGTPIDGNNESYNCEDWIP